MPKNSNNSNAQSYNHRASIIASIFDLSTIGVVFACKQLLLPWLNSIGQFILFPIGLAIQAIQAMLAWHQVYLDGGKKSRSWIKALVETGVTLGIGTAIIGVLLFTPVFAVATPFILTGTLGLRSLFHAAAAIFYLGKASAVPGKISVTNESGQAEIVANPKRAKYLKRAGENAASATIGLAVTAAIVTVMVLGHVKIAAFVGVPIAVASVGYGIFKLGSTFLGAKPQPASKGILDRQKRGSSHSLINAHRAEHQPLLGKATTSERVIEQRVVEEQQPDALPSVAGQSVFKPIKKHTSAPELKINASARYISI